LTMPKKPGRDKKTGARIVHETASKLRRTYSGIVKTPRSINELLERNSLASRITHKLSAQKSWTEWLREVVPVELAIHIVYVVPKESELVVFADTSAWGVRLRYAAAGLAAAIQERDPSITRTQVRVQPAAPIP
jgi:hypothetical protein